MNIEATPGVYNGAEHEDARSAFDNLLILLQETNIHYEFISLNRTSIISYGIKDDVQAISDGLVVVAGQDGAPTQREWHIQPPAESQERTDPSYVVIIRQPRGESPVVEKVFFYGHDYEAVARNLPVNEVLRVLDNVALMTNPDDI